MLATVFNVNSLLKTLELYCRSEDLKPIRKTI